MSRSRKSLDTPVAASSSALRPWEAANPNFLFSDTNLQRALGRPCPRLERAGA
ncbi:MAG: hypothetical protein KGN39_07730 [Betaproteobacteria bacterium]|nr:hypothetical protein [Betaproteobacteria bacterium]